MLRRAQIWHDLTAGYVVGALFGVTPNGTEDVDTTNVLLQALAGEAAHGMGVADRAGFDVHLTKPAQASRILEIAAGSREPASKAAG